MSGQMKTTQQRGYLDPETGTYIDERIVISGLPHGHAWPIGGYLAASWGDKFTTLDSLADATGETDLWQNWTVHADDRTATLDEIKGKALMKIGDGPEAILTVQNRKIEDA